MFENPRRGRQAINFTTNVPKILDLKCAPGKFFGEREFPIQNSYTDQVQCLSHSRDLKFVTSFKPSIYSVCDGLPAEKYEYSAWPGKTTFL